MLVSEIISLPHQRNLIGKINENFVYRSMRKLVSRLQRRIKCIANIIENFGNR